MDLTVVYEIVDRARTLGARRLGNGTELIGHVPHVAPEAWLHVLFAPIQAAGIEAIEEDLQLSLPREYAEFLQIHNGLRLFSRDLWIGGRRSNYARTGDMAWQPFCVALPNIEHGFTGATDEIIIGGVERSGATFRCRIGDGRVSKYKERGRKPISSWESLQDMLTSEATRLASIFDASGRRLTTTD